MKIDVYNNDKFACNNDSDLYQYALPCFLGLWGVVDDDIHIKVEINLNEEYSSNQDIGGGLLHLRGKEFLMIINQKNIEKIMGSKEDNPVGYTFQLLNNIAHECVHIKQYYYEELVSSFDSEVDYWKGEDVSHLEYSALPHEIEAYQYQDIMVEYYFQEIELLP